MVAKARPNRGAPECLIRARRCSFLPIVGIGKDVLYRFDGGDITSDAGLLLIAQADKKLGLIAALAGGIVDTRQPGKVKHDLATLLRQRIYAIAMGYSD